MVVLGGEAVSYERGSPVRVREGRTTTRLLGLLGRANYREIGGWEVGTPATLAAIQQYNSIVRMLQGYLAHKKPPPPPGPPKDPSHGPT
eukprot:CAMPEP_0180283852 /NCGR_PEP_ID=MMETSP0988-20121125/10777_1 /TAXON_ID=697907 /ORGANISM="non described non described, Strain CCMP2293" /LENGTH=88 /DNA_ID=CAMNT_0022256573 /DNA_START=23 /DNA_END=286 /DNA_ORIENTATION=-